MEENLKLRKRRRRQGDHLIAALKREIEIIELADEIIGYRFERGFDRLSPEIGTVIDEIKKLEKFLDDPSIFSVLVHRAKDDITMKEE